MSYLVTTYRWPLFSRPRVAGFDCPVTRADYHPGRGTLATPVTHSKQRIANNCRHAARIVDVDQMAM
jgi:hypothetical protein